jgi:tight adherence protein C
MAESVALPNISTLQLPIVVFIATVLIVLAVFSISRLSLNRRLASYSFALPNYPTLMDPHVSFSRRVITPLAEQLANLVRKMTREQIEQDVRQMLLEAGSPYGLDVTSFLALRGLGLFLPLLLIGAPRILDGSADVQIMGITLVLAGIGWNLPIIWVKNRITTRRKQVTRGLPDALDLIIVCVEAGNSLDSALSITSQRLKGPLAEEFSRMLREIALGKGRHDAMHDMAARVGAPDLQSFVAAIVQADQLGVSIGQVLRVQGESMRVRRRQRAEEQAAQAPVKMLIPLVLFILPSLMIIVLGPVIIRLLKMFSGG